RSLDCKCGRWPHSLAESPRVPSQLAFVGKYLEKARKRCQRAIHVVCVVTAGGQPTGPRNWVHSIAKHTDSNLVLLFEAQTAFQPGGRYFAGHDVVRGDWLAIGIGEDVERGECAVNAPARAGSPDRGVQLISQDAGRLIRDLDSVGR